MVRETQVKRFIIASPEFPSGVAWLINALLACHIRLEPIRSPDYWEETTPGKFRIRDREEEKIRARWLPILFDNKEFTFPEPIVLEWTHEFPAEDDRPFVYMHRHGKDALHSDYRRLNTSLSFAEYLKSPYPVERGSLAFIPGLPPAETWALHTLMWAEKQNGHFVSFEDTKRNPEAVLRSVLAFIGVERSEADIRKAIRLSSFEYAKSKEAEYLKTNEKGNVTAVYRSGKPGEWKEIYGAEELRCLEGLPNFALSKLGLETTPQAVTPIPGIEHAMKRWGLSKLLKFSGYFAPKPLILTAIAQTLDAKSDKALIGTLLEVAAGSELSFEERKALALNYLRIGKSQDAYAVLLPHIHPGLARPKIENLARELSQRSAFLLALSVLYRANFPGMSRLLLQEIRRQLPPVLAFRGGHSNRQA